MLWVITFFFALLFVLERVFPLRKRKKPDLHRLFVNGFMIMLTGLTAALFVKPATETGRDWVLANNVGLLNLFPLPVYLRFIIGFLLLDLSFYYWHRANHRFSFLWRLHVVHHLDADLDVSTGFRFHFGEIALSALFRGGQVLAIGASPLLLVVFQTVFLCATLFHHSNLRLPISVERLINKVLVTPRMHGIHHSFIKEETDSNYSTVFRWWDPLHRTLRLNVPQSRITIGVPSYSRTSDQTLHRALAAPFQKQPRYWRAPDGRTFTRPAREKGTPQRLQP